MTPLDLAEVRARAHLGHVEHWTIPSVRLEDLGTWASVTRDEQFLERAAQTEQVAVSGMYLVGQLQPHPWPKLDALRVDGLSRRDSPGAGADDPIGVLHGGGRVQFRDRVLEGMPYHARREVVAVERKGRADRPFIRVTVMTHFSDDGGALVVEYEEYILLREVER